MPKRKRSSHQDTLRTSERNTLNRCRQRWAWGYEDKLSPKREAPALRFGTLIHGALEHYYSARNQSRRRPVHPAATFATLFDEELTATEREWAKWRDEDDEWHTYRELGVVMLEGYVDHWRAQDKEYIVLAVEQRFTIPIATPSNKPKLAPPSPTKYVGTIDRILYHLPTRRLLFGDYKTTKSDPTKNPHLILDEQAGAYLAQGVPWLAQNTAIQKQMRTATAHLPKSHRQKINDLQFDGIMFDFLKKALPDSRPVNAEGYSLNQDKTVSKKQPGPLFHREPVFRDVASSELVLERIYQDALEIGKLRRGELVVKKSPDRFICIGCQFIDMCELHESGADWMAFRDGMYEDWDPYSTYWIDNDELA